MPGQGLGPPSPPQTGMFFPGSEVSHCFAQSLSLPAKTDREMGALSVVLASSCNLLARLVGWG